MTPGRNEPCHCGSGKKYKHCHLEEDQKPDPESAFVEAHLRFTDDLMVKLHEYIEKIYAEESFMEALAEFSGLFGPIVEREDDDLEEALFTPEGQFFLTWYTHFWTPREDETDGKTPLTPVARILQDEASPLTPEERAYLEVGQKATLSYYEVMAVEPEHGITLKSCFTEETVLVKDMAVAGQAQVGHLQFAMVIPWKDRYLYEALSPYDMGPEMKVAVLALKARFAEQGDFSAGHLRELDLELLKLHGDLTMEKEGEAEGPTGAT